MKGYVGRAATGGLLAFNGGFVDVAGFLGLHGLFAAHVTGNLATLCAAIVLGSDDLIGKILAVPEFIAVVALARLAGAGMHAAKWPARIILLAAELILLVLLFGLGLRFGPFSDYNSLAALVTAFAAIAAMAVQNAMQRMYLPDVPATTFMTGNATDATIGAIALWTGDVPKKAKRVRSQTGGRALNFCCFAVGCAVAAAIYREIGFWCLAVPVAVTGVAMLMPVENQPNSRP